MWESGCRVDAPCSSLYPAASGMRSVAIQAASSGYNRAETGCESSEGHHSRDSQPPSSLSTDHQPLDPWVGCPALLARFWREGGQRCSLGDATAEKSRAGAKGPTLQGGKKAG